MIAERAGALAIRMELPPGHPLLPVAFERSNANQTRSVPHGAKRMLCVGRVNTRKKGIHAI